MDIFQPNQIIEFIQIYVLIGLAFLVLNSFIAGYNATTWVKQDFIDSLFWPLSLAILAGLSVRLLIEKIKSNPKGEK